MGRGHLVQLAIMSRLVMLLCMSVSNRLLPDFLPGDDVLQFDLRLDDHGGTPVACFCLKGHACDPRWATQRLDRESGMDSPIEYPSCAGEQCQNTRRWRPLDKLYSFVLPPVTKWDAARFLTLSADPMARHPPPDNNRTILNPGDEGECDQSDGSHFDSSEQAHAFFPLLPLVIRHGAALLRWLVPQILLPKTYEGTLVLAAILMNMVAFAVAALSLHDLTLYNLLAVDPPDKRRKPKTEEEWSEDISEDIGMIAQRTCQIFCLNPAGVFFTAAYSESLFSALTFAGHAIIARGRYRIMTTQAKSKRSSWIAAAFVWGLASCARSNGLFASIWILLVCISDCCSFTQSYIDNKNKKIDRLPGDTTHTNSTLKGLALKCLWHLLFCTCLATMVMAPIVLHDRRGYGLHCGKTETRSRYPQWCTGEGFSFYSFVQKKHWNVGFLNYYELKQVPNHILAFPILFLSYSAAANWIFFSWRKLSDHEMGFGGFLRTSLSWVFEALAEASYFTHNFDAGENAGNVDTLLLGHRLLPFYATLAGFALVGTFFAHVQISTRLILSSCPAIYWYMLKILSDKERRQQSTATNPIKLFLLVYNILGVVMHVNWLPWT